MVNKIKLILYRFIFLFLDFISIPGIFMNKKNNAKYHLNVICPLCPKCRRKYRAVQKEGICWWEENWKKENYGIPRHFGISNWLKSYLGINTNLLGFK
jgi:hypothetical protein